MALKAVPWLQVGILSAPQVRFCFSGAYTWEGTQYEGDQEAVCSDGQITFAGRRYASLTFQPVDEQATFVIEEVTIGVQFHWQRKEQQRFAGGLRLVVDPASKGSQLVVINEIDVERYLTSVISSEMSATASKALLKAHAVISRSWVLARCLIPLLPASNPLPPMRCRRARTSASVGTTTMTIPCLTYAPMTIANVIRV